VGGSEHLELWIPAEELETFNRHIVGTIRVVASYAGPHDSTVVMLDAVLSDLGITADVLHSRGLQRQLEAMDLEVAETGPDGREHLLVPSAAGAWREMKAAALADGESLFIVSAFRSVTRQAQIVRSKLRSGASIEEVIAVCAPPGYSEHHTGRAVDLSTPGVRPLEIEFASSFAFRWLRRNAARFAFELSYPPNNPQGYQYEPWHWCHRGA
jgi:D-alanyl-D-alanine carboxypeptidase